MRGFSLVLSLVVMSMLLLLVISLTALLAIELRLTSAFTDRQKARLNAVAGLRIALAQLQQEAGADQRITAQANVTLPAPNATAAEIRALWARKNPYWTGVWDTSDAARPPAWLVSGKAQMNSPLQKYETGYQIPWTALADTGEASPPVSLFPDIDATAEPQDAMAPFDTQVTAARIPLVSGGYAYWVSDEGLKARLNLRDPFVDAIPHSEQGLTRLSAPGRAGAELFPRWGGIAPNASQLAFVLNTPGFANLEGFPASGTAAHPNPAATYAHAVTAHSRGVLSDARHGGLRKDLTLAFEMSEEDFKKSPFHTTDPVTLNMTGTGDLGTAPVESTQRWERVAMALAENSVRRPSTPVFNIKLPDKGYVRNLRGPTWEVMHNYYNLRKEFQGDGTLFSRILYPNSTSNMNLGQASGDNYSYTHVYPSIKSSRDPYTADEINWYGGALTPLPRPTRASVTPYVARYLLLFSLQASPESASDPEGKPRKRVRLVVNPIIVVHNPYNVPLKFQTDAIPLPSGVVHTGMRCSMRSQAGLNITIKERDSSGNEITHLGNRSLETIFHDQASATSGTEQFRTFIPNETIQPGEFVVFSSGHEQPVLWEHAMSAKRDLWQLGGFYLEKLRPGGQQLEVGEDSTLTIQVNAGGGDFYMRELLKCWPGDRIDASGQGGAAFYRQCSEITEFIFYRGSNSTAGNMGTTNAPVSLLRPPGQPLLHVGMLEFFEKPVEFVGGDGSQNRFPTHIMSNPLATMVRNDAQGSPRGFNNTAVSWQYRLKKVTDIAAEIELSGKGLGYGGHSYGSNGSPRVVRANVPRAPLANVGQYQSANIGIADHRPLYATGNSFATPYVPTNALYKTAGNWTNFDYAWLLNNALWDRFYFSTIAPEARVGMTWGEIRSQEKVWAEFLQGEQNGSRKPLLNPHLTLSPTADATAARAILDDRPNAYRKSAAHLLQDGAFNINATDARAWKTTLGSTRETPVPGTVSGASLGGAGTRQTAFPRTVPVAVTDNFARNNRSDPAAWAGAKALDDTQLGLLAESLVEKMRQRWSVAPSHAVSYTTPAGDALVRPFFSVAEFVNRALGDDDTAKLGVLQAALFHADKARGADINTAFNTPVISAADLDGSKGQGNFPHPEVVTFTDGTQIPVSAGAPGMLLQGDILQTIGARLSARSDTFVIRAYGDAKNKTGSATSSKAWLEAVVQRVPEYLDATQPADETAAGINRRFGRRFHIVSLRWLSPDEL
ncbi:MAG: hypothetical protein LBD14_05505 [Puniceicoccales bacterium]|nr:hypothetical protein [Puniceicoccales bacterium]